MSNVNLVGYLVQSRKDGSLRTYACANLKGLKDLILHLTGREWDTFVNVKDSRGLPNLQSLGIMINYPLHIWE